MRLSRALLAIAAAALVVAAAGCGSDSESSSSAPSGTASTTTQQRPGAKSTTTPTHDGSAGKPGGASGGGSGPAAQSPASEKREIVRANAEEGESSDQSIQEYGSEAGDAEEEAVVEAMRTFVGDLAAGDYEAVCGELSSGVLEQFETFMKAQERNTGTPTDCPTFLAKIAPNKEKGKAQRILAGVVTRVRIGEGNAFLLVKPKGEPVNYFVFSLEDGAWKPTSLAMGSSLVR